MAWHVRQESVHAVMETEIFCRKREMLLVNYEAPDGSKKHKRLWNGGNGWGTVRLYDKQGGELSLVDEMEATHVGCEYGEPIKFLSTVSSGGSTPILRSAYLIELIIPSPESVRVPSRSNKMVLYIKYQPTNSATQRL